MGKLIWTSLVVAIALMLLLAWRDGERRDARRAAATVSASASTPGNPLPAPPTASASQRSALPPPGEPPESVLVRFKHEEYDEIQRAGGMPVVVTATGQRLVLKPRIYAARKDGCRLLPGRTDAYECSLDMRVTLREGDREPGQHAERVHAYWDGQMGEWRRRPP
jgi:hypothetical protein